MNQGESKEKGKEMWKCLGELNKEFKGIKKFKKDSKKCGTSYLRCK